MKNLTSKTGKLIIAVVVSFGFGFGSGWPTGWMYRDHQLVSTYNSYRDVSVERRYDATHYLLRPAGMGVYKFDFDAPQDFDEGQKMAGLEYEQRLGVKHVIRAYFCPTHCDSNGRRINYREEVTNARN